MKKTVSDLTNQFNKLEDEIMNLKKKSLPTTEPAGFLTFGLLIKLFLINLFILIFKAQISTQVLYFIIALCFLLILYKVFLVRQEITTAEELKQS